MERILTVTNNSNRPKPVGQYIRPMTGESQKAAVQLRAKPGTAREAEKQNRIITALRLSVMLDR
jgi:hypothetical protein